MSNEPQTSLDLVIEELRTLNDTLLLIAELNRSVKW